MRQIFLEVINSLKCSSLVTKLSALNAKHYLSAANKSILYSGDPNIHLF